MNNWHECSCCRYWAEMGVLVIYKDEQCFFCWFCYKDKYEETLKVFEGYTTRYDVEKHRRNK